MRGPRHIQSISLPMMEPASDSESDSDSSISAAGNIPDRRNDGGDVPQSRRNRRMMHHHHDDDDDGGDSSSLPSSSSDDDDDGSSSDSDGDGDDNHNVENSSSTSEEEDQAEAPEDDTDLQSRLRDRQSGDATFGTSAVSSLRRRKAGRKEAALSLASERLAAFRKQKQRRQSKKTKGAYDSDSDGSDDDDGDRKMDKKNTTKKKRSKHAPTEASSRRSDYYKRGAPQLNSSGIGVEVGANRYRARDPRLENMSGRYDEEVFERRYAFLDDLRQEEMARLTKRIAARRATGKAGQKMRRRLGLTGPDGGTLEEDEAELVRLKQDRADRKRSQTQRLAKRAVKKRIRDEIAEGRRGAYHVKRSELKRMELEARFEEIRKRGGDAAVEKELAKKRKRQESKSKRHLPSR